jgi:hypothetical protein
MAKWFYIIDIKHLTENVDDDTESLKEFSQGVVNVLSEFIEKARRNPRLSHEYWDELKDSLNEVREEFELLAVDPSVERDEVQDRLNELYDWADQGVYDEVTHQKLGNLAWVNSMFDYSGEKQDELSVRNGFLFSHLAKA